MFTRQSVHAPNPRVVRVTFTDEEEIPRPFDLADPKHAKALIQVKQDERAADEQCQNACNVAESMFNQFAKEAEAEYARRAADLRAQADAAIKAAQEAHIAARARLTAKKEVLEETAFEKAERAIAAEQRKAKK